MYYNRRSFYVVTHKPQFVKNNLYKPQFVKNNSTKWKIMTRVLSQIRDSIRTFNVRTVLIHQIQLSLVEPFYNDDDDGYGYGWRKRWWGIFELMMTYSAATWLLLLPLLILLRWSWWWSDDVDGLVAGFLLFYVSLSLSLYLSISSNCTDSLSSYKCWMINDSDMMWRKEWFDSWCLIPTGEAVGKDALWKSRNY